MKKQISITAVAEACKVSTMTVSRALRNNNAVHESTREKIIAMAKKLGYIRANRMGRPALKNEGGSKKIELIIGTSGKGIAVFYSQLITAIENNLSKEGYDCVIKMCNGSYEQLLSLQDNLRNSTSDASIIVGFFKPEYLKSLFELIPDAILLDNPGDPIIDRPYASFCFDNVEASRISIQHLLSIKRKKILLITGLKGHFFSEEIEQGYRDCLSVRDIPIEERLIVNTDFTSEGAYQAMQSVFAQSLEFDAVFTNDEMASGVYRALLERGLRIPEDLAICGCDGLPLGMHLYPRLTTVVLDYTELSRRVIQYLLYERKLDSPIRVRLLPRLEVRESTLA